MKSSGGVFVARGAGSQPAVGMYSKSLCGATWVSLAVFATACSSVLPWNSEPVGQEVNIAFTLQNNLPFLTATVDGRPGRFLFGSAEPQSILDPKFANGESHALQFNDRESVPVRPVVEDLHGVADGIIGADVWGGNAVTLDYRAGLLIYQKEGIHPDGMTVYTYADMPMINVVVDGRRIPSLVDTASPDTLVLPRAGTAAGRRMAHVEIAGTDFGSVSVKFADVTAPHIGNRLLSRFLVTIDYGRRMVGLWRDPRTPL
jgi:hypothetical protein